MQKMSVYRINLLLIGSKIRRYWFLILIFVGKAAIYPERYALLWHMSKGTNHPYSWASVFLSLSFVVTLRHFLSYVTAGRDGS